MTRRLQTRSGAVLAAAVLLATSACSSDAPSEPTADSTDTGTPATEDPATEDPATAEPAGDELDEDSFVPAITAAMVEAGTARIETSVDAAGESIRIVGIQQVGDSLADNAMELTMRGGGLDGRMVLVDKTLYVDLGPVTGGKYFRVDLDDPHLGALFGQLLQSTDTAAAVKSLQGAVEGLEVVGPADVGGVETTRYRLTVDAAEALSTQGVPGSVIDNLPDTLSYDMWVDADRLLRKAVIDVASVSTTITASEWGEPVDITAPPPAQITKDDPFSAPS